MKVVLAALVLAATFSIAQDAPSGALQKQFVENGKIRLDLGLGDYEITRSHSSQIRINWVTGDAKAPSAIPVTVEVTGASAHVAANGTSDHFHLTIEVPKSTNLEVHQRGGGLRIEGIIGDKDLENTKGHIVVQVGNPDQYRHVEVSVNAGNLFATPFERVKRGLGRSFTWDGPGSYSLNVRLAEGDINLVPGDEI